MLIDPFKFKNLIFPITPRDFFENYWEKKPLILTNRKAKGYKNLLSLKDVDQMVKTLASLKDPVAKVQFINNKKILSLEDYINPETGVLSLSKVHTGYRNGNTIYLHRIEHRSQKAHDLCREIEKALGHLINAELFLTPPSAQGFNIHYDAVDAFVLQLEGHKKWKVYNRLVEFPVGTGETPYMGDVEKPLFDGTLSPGDLLYIPRGYLHQASTANDYSLHITLAVRVFSWADLFHEMLQLKTELRKALPIGLLHQSSMQNYPQMIQNLFSEKEMESAFKRIKSRFMKKKKHARDESLSGSFLHQKIETNTLYQKETDLILTKEANKLRLSFRDDEIFAPDYVEPLLEHILQNEHFSLRTLPNVITPSGKKVLLENLLNAGAIAPINQRKNHGQEEENIGKEKNRKKSSEKARC